MDLAFNQRGRCSRHQSPSSLRPGVVRHGLRSQQAWVCSTTHGLYLSSRSLSFLLRQVGRMAHPPGRDVGVPVMEGYAQHRVGAYTPQKEDRREGPSDCDPGWEGPPPQFLCLAFPP